MEERMQERGVSVEHATIQRDNDALSTALIIRQGQYVTQMIAQDHHSVTRVTRRRPGGRGEGTGPHTGRTMLRSGGLILSPSGLARSPLKICDRTA
jgi:hypothetical protein